MRNAPHRRIRNSAAPVVALLALAAIAAGCGGGSDSGSETASRKKLVAASEKLADAKSLRAELFFEVEEDGEPEELGCLILAVDTHGRPERFDLTFFDQNCSGGSEAHELIAVGRRAWSSSSNGAVTWREAKISPALLDELDDERTDFKDLIAAAEGIDEVPGGGTVKEGEHFVDATSFDFEAPASAFPGSDADLGDLDVEFEAVIDREGYLRKVVVHGDEGGTGATVTENFEDVDEDLGIGPPDPADVHGKVEKIRTQSDLDRLFGGSAP